MLPRVWAALIATISLSSGLSGCGSEATPNGMGSGNASGSGAAAGTGALSGAGSGGSTATGGMTGSGGTDVAGSGAGGSDVAGGSGGGSGANSQGGTSQAGSAGVAQGGTDAGTSGGGAGSANAPPGALGPFTCPPPPYAAAPFVDGATAVRVEGVPPADDFIASADDLVIIEGPVWLDGALYFSQIEAGSSGPGGFGGRGGGNGNDGASGTAGLSGASGSAGDSGNAGAGGEAGQNAMPPPARVLQLSADGSVAVALDDVGTNGLGLDASGSLVGCSHKTGSVTRFSLTGDAPVDLVANYLGSRFNSPNDLTFGADGTLYFTDPDYQAPAPAPQTATRAYRVAPGSSEAIPIADGVNQPNGITLSPARTTLYVSGSNGVYAYPVLADGSLGEGVRFAQGVVQSSDGMAVDCAGNLYTTGGQNVVVTSPDGVEMARLSVPGVQSVTNVAFGGADRTTLYVTALGTGTRSGLFTVASAIPGMPY